MYAIRSYYAEKNTVDTVLDDNPFLVRFNVNIACALVESIKKRRVDEPDDRTGIGSQLLDGKDLFPLVIV